MNQLRTTPLDPEKKSRLINRTQNDWIATGSKSLDEGTTGREDIIEKPNPEPWNDGSQRRLDHILHGMGDSLNCETIASDRASASEGVGLLSLGSIETMFRSKGLNVA